MVSRLGPGIVRFALVVACTLGFSGCVAVSSERARQVDEIGDLELTSVLCAGSPDPQAGCPTGNTDEPAGSGNFQLLYAVRLPARATAPETVVAADGSITLSASATYTAEIHRLAAAPAGQRWAGYLSPPFAYDAAASPRQAELVARFGLARGADGSPFQGPFRYRTIVGYRDAGPDDARPVECGASLTVRSGNTICQDWPGEEELATNIEVGVRDLGVLAGGSGQAPTGASGSVPFSLVWTGATAGPSFAISATTSVPGGSAAAAQAAFVPTGPGTTGLPVAVSVPPGTPAGDYEVVLSARIGAQLRQASARLTVVATAVDRDPPEITAVPKGRTDLASVLARGLLVDAGCDEPCRFSAEMRIGSASARRLRLKVPRGARSLIVGRGAERQSADGLRSIRVHVVKAYKPKLRRLRRLPFSLRVVARDEAGNARTRTLRLALVR